MKVAIAIQSCNAYKERRDAIRDTWLKDVPCGIDTAFFVGRGDADDATALPCGDTYDDCWVKQFEMIKYMKDYDFVFFCDDDTYAVVDRLMLSGFEKHDYMGCPCDVYEGEIVMAHGGAGFWMSSYAMAMAVEVGLDHPKFTKTIFSDRTVGYLMDIAGIKLHGDYRFNLGKYHGHKGFCNLVPNRQNLYITTHFVKPKMMPLIYAHFKEGVPLPPNCYTMGINGRRVDFSEKNGKWWYFVWGDTAFKGEFDLAQQAEFAAMKDISSR